MATFDELFFIANYQCVAENIANKQRGVSLLFSLAQLQQLLHMQSYSSPLSAECNSWLLLWCCGHCSTVSLFGSLVLTGSGVGRVGLLPKKATADGLIELLCEEALQDAQASRSLRRKDKQETSMRKPRNSVAGAGISM